MSTAVHCTIDKMPEDEKYRLLESVIKDYDYDANNLIQILHYAQSIFGYLDLPTQKFISEKMRLPFSKVSGVVTFYSFFNTMPKGRHTISICLGTACYVKGGKKIIEKLKDVLGIDVGETTEDLKYSIEIKRCIGACGLAPAISIDDNIHKRVNPSRLQNILDQYE